MKPHITLVALYPVNSSTVIIVILMKTCHTLLSQVSIHLAISSLLDFAKCGFFLLFLVGCNKSKLWLDMIFASEAKQNVSAYRLMTLWSMYYSSAVYKPFLYQHSHCYILLTRSSCMFQLPVPLQEDHLNSAGYLSGVLSTAMMTQLMRMTQE